MVMRLSLWEVMGMLRDFIEDRRGNVAMMFSLAVVGLVGLTGLAVEYSRGSAMQVKMAAAADAAALAGAKAIGTPAERRNIAQNVFDAAMVSIPGMSNIVFSGNNVMDKGVVIGFKVAATGDMETTLGRIFGSGKIGISTNSQAVAGTNENLEIALALDTTGSMSGVKLDTLKTAATNLVNTLTAKATQPGQVKFAIVPFAQYVNVGLSNRNASWIDVPAEYTETKTVDVYTYPNMVKSNCRMETKTGHNDGVPYTYQAEVCDIDYGDPVITPTDYTYTYTWSGCVGSRNHPLNTQDGSYVTKVPGLLNVSCGNELLPLTGDKNTVLSAINGLSASGNTYIPSGLVWGWRALSPGAPFAESASGAPNVKVQQVLILMTDGANTKSPTYPEHWGSDTVLANTLTGEICSNIKAAPNGIKVYTIAFEVTDTAIKSILQNCASSASNYYDASDAAKLVAAFENIATQLSALRLSK